MFGGFVANAVNTAVDTMPIMQTETFESHTGVGIAPARATIVSFITILIVFAAILLAGKYLWNNVLHELVPAIKPAKSVWQILGLAILIALLSPGNCQVC